jgi:two-component system nitrogen regulation response regulator GlnG
MQAVFRKIALVSTHDVPVLISGESGTGKELVAQAIHDHSGRVTGPFIPICVPAMPSSLIESELFGHRGGAFTGARDNRVGLLTQADGGSAFFDEIGEVTLATQVKLLRVLETRSVLPVGSNEARAANFRLIAATNRRLDQMVAAGSFREDLFHRLNVFHIELPPLRDRREDIPLLAEHFLRQLGPGGRQFSPAMLAELLSRPWHGNVRELRNAIEHAAIVGRGATLEPDALPSPASGRSTEHGDAPSIGAAVSRWINERIEQAGSTEELAGLYEQFLKEAEPTLFTRALQLADGNRQEASRLLGMHRQTLRERLRKYDLEDSTGNPNADT